MASFISNELNVSMKYFCGGDSNQKYPLDLRIVSTAINLFATFTMLSNVCTVGSILNYPISYFNNYTTTLIFSGDDSAYALREIAKSAAQLVGASELMKYALFVSAVSLAVLGVLVAYRRCMHPDFYTNKA